MNKRIKRLLEEVGGHGTLALMHPDDVEKFAKLIVQECILVIEEEAEHIHAEGTTEAIVNLEKHFGVE